MQNKKEQHCEETSSIRLAIFSARPHRILNPYSFLNTALIYKFSTKQVCFRIAYIEATSDSIIIELKTKHPILTNQQFPHEFCTNK